MFLRQQVCLGIIFFLSCLTFVDERQLLAELDVSTTRQTPLASVTGQFSRVVTDEHWNESETALIICDVWDSHHCVNAVRRVQEIAPRIDALASTLRKRGSTIIHAPSDCMAFYEGHPARERAKSIKPALNLPKDLNRWCDRIPSEEQTSYPVDQSDGGEDDDLQEHEQWAKTLAASGRNPKLPWKQQIPTIRIDNDHDFVTDVGSEVWNILEERGIKQVLICGVHTNMCVLGRPFGLRQLTQHGKRAVLVKDLTDTMYNPARWPFVSHFTGTDLVIDHVERYVCSTVTSDFLLQGGSIPGAVEKKYSLPAKFSKDRRPLLAVLIAEDEYQTAETLPLFIAKHLRQNLKVSLIFGDEQDKSKVLGLDAIDDADALLISVRRRPLAKDNLRRIKAFVESGKSIVGIRTASHAFCLRDGKQIEGLEQWPEFDSYAFGGSYTNHHPNELIASLRKQGESSPSFESKGSLYQVSPLKPGVHISWFGKVDGQPEEPVAWSFVRPDGGHSFYTSLGHPMDFEEPLFVHVLANACLRACDLPEVNLDELNSQKVRYSSGTGKQR